LDITATISSKLTHVKGYNDIVITLETIKDVTPAEHILEGTAE